MFDEKDLVLEAKHVTRKFQASGGRTLTACDDVSLNLYRGKTLGLVGESGCGKSTFMRMIVSLDTPTEGEILFNGVDITKLKGEQLRQHRQHIQMVFQDPTGSMNPKMKVRDIICEPLLNFDRISKSEKDAKARELLEMVELPGDFADRFPHNMSGGQRQRVAVARALVTHPSIILADEPTGNLDTATSEEVMKLFDAIHRKGNTIILVTHEEDVARHACRIIRLRDGKIESDENLHQDR